VGNTVFCPTNSAFIRLGRRLGVSGPRDGVTSQLLALAGSNAAAFTAVLSAHAVAGTVNSTAAAKLANGPPVPTLLPGFTFTVTYSSIITKNLKLLFPVANLRGGNRFSSEAKVLATDFSLAGIT
jgi:hypothetical protein